MNLRGEKPSSNREGHCKSFPSRPLISNSFFCSHSVHWAKGSTANIIHYMQWLSTTGRISLYPSSSCHTSIFWSGSGEGLVKLWKPLYHPSGIYPFRRAGFPPIVSGRWSEALVVRAQWCDSLQTAALAVFPKGSVKHMESRHILIWVSANHFGAPSCITLQVWYLTRCICLFVQMRTEVCALHLFLRLSLAWHGRRIAKW